MRGLSGAAYIVNYRKRSTEGLVMLRPNTLVCQAELIALIRASDCRINSPARIKIQFFVALPRCTQIPNQPHPDFRTGQRRISFTAKPRCRQINPDNWIPAHSDFDRNEAVDVLAKRACKDCFLEQVRLG